MSQTKQPSAAPVLSREQRREKVLSARLRVLNAAVNANFRVYARVKVWLDRAQNELETLWTNQRARQKRRAEQAVIMENIRRERSERAAFYMWRGFRSLTEQGSKMAGAFLGISRLIVARKQNWKQFQFYEQLLFEAGFDHEPVCDHDIIRYSNRPMRFV